MEEAITERAGKENKRQEKGGPVREQGRGLRRGGLASPLLLTVPVMGLFSQVINIYAR